MVQRKLSPTLSNDGRKSIRSTDAMLSFHDNIVCIINYYYWPITIWPQIINSSLMEFCQKGNDWALGECSCNNMVNRSAAVVVDKRHTDRNKVTNPPKKVHCNVCNIFVTTETDE